MDEQKGTLVELGTHRKRIALWSICVGIASIAIGATTAGLIVYNKYKIYDDPNVQKIIAAYDIMVNDYLFGDENIGKECTDAAIDGLTSKGDKYTFYTSTYQEQNLDATSAGLGFRYAYYGGNIYVNNLYKDSPAYAAGIRKGDVISASYYSNTWKTFEDYSYADVLNYLENSSSNDLKFKVKHKGESEIKEISYIRKEYHYNGVTLISKYKTSENKVIATIKIDTFLDSRVYEFTNAVLNNVETELGPIDQLNIDLRDNGGGYVSAAVDLCSLFVPKDTSIMEYCYKDGKTEELKTTRNPFYSHIKKFNIIQNGGTASASESFALAMKYLKNATIIGETSYGKGIAQTFYYFGDGSVMRYTFAKTQYRINKNEAICINGVGIKATENYDYSHCLHYYGEADFGAHTQEEVDNAIKVILQEINSVMGSSYTDYVEAMNNYQSSRLLTVTGDMNIATGRLLQKECYDYYISSIEYVNSNIIG